MMNRPVPSPKPKILTKIQSHGVGFPPSKVAKVEKFIWPTGCFHPRLLAKQGQPKPWDEWTLKDFEIGKPLGEGAFGFVYLARTVNLRYIVALKVMHMEQIVKHHMEDQINRETLIHSQLNHPNIVRMQGCFLDVGKSVFVLEYCPGGDVYRDMMSQPKKRYHPKKAATFIYQVASALEYLHGKHIIHRDIKPENLLIGYYGEVKLSDFGWSIQTKPTSQSRRKTVCGTLDYLPPEMIRQGAAGGYDKTADLWCLGVLMFEFLIGKPPFESADDKKTKENIVKSELEFPDFVLVDDGAKRLIRKMLQKDPTRRPDLPQIRNDPWIKATRNETRQLLPMFEPYSKYTESIKQEYEKVKKRMM